MERMVAICEIGILSYEDFTYTDKIYSNLYIKWLEKKVK